MPANPIANVAQLCSTALGQLDAAVDKYDSGTDREKCEAIDEAIASVKLLAGQLPALEAARAACVVSGPSEEDPDEVAVP